MKTYPCIESTFEFYITDGVTYKVRIWRNVNLVASSYINHDIVDSKPPFGSCLSEIAEFYAQFPNVNAVQVINLSHPHNAGVMIYTVDF